MKSFKIGDLKIPLPIVQGGMGIGISLSGLASAVANMGGIGIISTVGIGFLENKKNLSLANNHIQTLRETIAKARGKTKGILGVNIMSVITNFSDMVKTSIEEGIDIIFSGAGLPLDLPKYLTANTKTKLVPIVSSGRAAQIICDKWKNNYDYLPDALVVEGPNAGGHLGFKPNDLLHEKNSLEKILDEVLQVTSEIKEKFNRKIPVIAAGGIFTGKDIFRFIKQGASAVQMGTRFVATEECDASQEFKNAFINALQEDVKIIQSPVGMPGRAIYNNFLKEADEGSRKPVSCKYNCIKSCKWKETKYCIASALLSAYQGNLENGFAFSGSNSYRISKISTVKEIINELINEYKEEEKKESNN